MSRVSLLAVLAIALLGFLTWRLTSVGEEQLPRQVIREKTDPGPTEAPLRSSLTGEEQTIPGTELARAEASREDAGSSRMARPLDEDRSRTSPAQVLGQDDRAEEPLKEDETREPQSAQARLLAAQNRLWDAGYVGSEPEAILESWDKAEAYAQARHGADPIIADNPPPQFHEEQSRYDSAIRSQMSEADYDAGRYANDLTNRAEIVHLPEESDLMLEGLMLGDLVRAVNGQAIYTVGDFMMWRRENRGALMSNPVITVERPSTGETFQIQSPMARVGILENVRVAPTPP